METSKKELEALKKAHSLLEEFKNFALKGNVINLAIGLIIGAAFGKIVDSLVKNIIMPTIGVLTPGEQGYIGWKWIIGQKEIPYGLFLGEIVNFLVVAAALFFFIVKFLGWVTHRRILEDASPSTQEKLLTEIRDLLKERSAARAIVELPKTD